MKIYIWGHFLFKMSEIKRLVTLFWQVAAKTKSARIPQPKGSRIRYPKYTRESIAVSGKMSRTLPQNEIHIRSEILIIEPNRPEIVPHRLKFHINIYFLDDTAYRTAMAGYTIVILCNSVYVQKCSSIFFNSKTSAVTCQAASYTVPLHTV